MVHATFKLSFNLIHTETPLYSMLEPSDMDQVLQNCELIVWDMCTMAHKGCFNHNPQASGGTKE